MRGRGSQYRPGLPTAHSTSYRIMRVHPAIVSLETARKYYKRMSEGKQRVVLKYNRLGKVLVGRGNENSDSNACDLLPQVHLVTPTAMAAEQARAKIKRRPSKRAPPRPKRKQTGGKRKKQPIRRKPKRVQKKKKTTVKRVIKGRVTKRKAHSKRGSRRDNFS